MESCVFCDILKDDKLHQIIAEKGNFVAIKKIYLSEVVNLMIITKEHIDNLNSDEKVDLNIPERDIRMDLTGPF